MSSTTAEPATRDRQDTGDSDRSDRPRSASRRGALLAAASGLALTTAACRPGADVKPVGANIGPTSSSPSPTRRRPTGSTTSKGGATGAPVVPGRPGTLRLPRDLDVEHLVRRVTYGPTPGLVEHIRKVGPQAWLAAQLEPAKIPDPGAGAVLRALPQAGLTLSPIKNVPGPRLGVVADLQAAHVGRAVFSERQLLEVMVDFWSNHLNVNAHVGEGKPVLRTDYDVMIRRHVLGRFADLLQSSAEHAAMLKYLNGRDNTREKPNENYARELMELHTLGVDGGYSERDVKQAALLLTGWQVKDVTGNLPVFIPKEHYVGPVTILGHKIANSSADGGVAAMRDFYAFLAKHPATAKHVCSQLAVRFVSDDPPATLVDRLAKVYLRSNTEILPVLRELFSSPEFAGSAGQKLRRPIEYTAAVLRRLGARSNEGGLADGLRDVRQRLNSHQPLDWPAPDGYPDRAARWQSSGVALEQYNIASVLIDGRVKGLGLPAMATLMPASVGDVDAVTAVLTRRLYGRAPTAVETKAARVLIKGNSASLTFKNPNQRFGATWVIATLLLNSPELLTR
jgi:uncharacterized protein (DUF1800 family)